MSKEICTSCQRPKASLHCGVCNETICKSCASFLDESTFSFLDKIPADLTHSYYCSPCYSTHVDPALADYNEVLSKAKNVFFFFRSARKPTALLSKSKESIKIASCLDRDETILRLGFK